MKRGERRKQAWKAPSEIQNHPRSGQQRVQVRDRAGKCRIAFAGKVNWATIDAWRWA